MLKHRKENLRAIRYTQEHRKAYKQVEKETQSKVYKKIWKC